MTERSPDHSGADGMTEVQRGLRMAQPPDPQALAREREYLANLEGQGGLARARGYLKLIGPGYMQSAMTLGSGTAAASLFAGAVYGYQLLWVAPVAMALGVIVLSAVSHQTLSTGRRPMEAMSAHAGKFFAVGWALAALIASVIWHLPQYNLAAATMADMAVMSGWESPPTMLFAGVALVWAVGLSMVYGRSARLIRWYERLIKYMVWGIVLCFGWVVVRTQTDWGAVAAGFVPFQFPEGNDGAPSSLSLVVASLAAAVGVNMLFLYPYSLLARQWGREHRRLARFDLITGMLIPYSLATSLMVIATANTLHAEGVEVTKNLAIPTAAKVLGGDDIMGPSGRMIFDLGILGMALSSITLHMQVCGFVAMEWLGVKFGSRSYYVATLLPTPAFLAPLIWADSVVHLAVPTTILCGSLMPIAYIGFFLLQRSKAYLGADRPEGVRGVLWLAGIALATATLVAFLVSYAASL